MPVMAAWVALCSAVVFLITMPNECISSNVISLPPWSDVLNPKHITIDDATIKVDRAFSAYQTRGVEIGNWKPIVCFPWEHGIVSPKTDAGRDYGFVLN